MKTAEEAGNKLFDELMNSKADMDEHRKLISEHIKYYHEQKLKELTDEVIITEVKKVKANPNLKDSYYMGVRLGVKKGAQYARDWYLKNNT